MRRNFGHVYSGMIPGGGHHLCDVGPRDGLQNDAAVVAPAVRAELCERLAATGLPRVEAASFVHPKLVPQMAGAEEVFAALSPDGATWAALVSIAAGLDRAVAAGAGEIHVAYPGDRDVRAAQPEHGPRGGRDRGG